jgi:serine acetyltransferase
VGHIQKSAVCDGAKYTCQNKCGDALVGAGSLVLSHVATNVVVAGNPAKFMRKIDY